MMMTQKRFQEYLMLYGAGIENWPEELQADAMRASHQPAMAALVIEQHYFDEILWNNDVIAPASADFAGRIINAAGKSSAISFTEWLQELLSFLLPQPVFVLATVLTFGIAIGLSLPAPQMGVNDTITQAYFEDDGAML